VQFTVLAACAVPETVTVAGVRLPTDVRERRAPPAPAAPARSDRSDRSDCLDPAERRGPDRAPGPVRRGHARAARAVL
jgi:hypothetical protein